MGTRCAWQIDVIIIIMQWQWQNSNFLALAVAMAASSAQLCEFNHSVVSVVKTQEIPPNQMVLQCFTA